jgi:medium-chain acyl-[acyl-carrier-protein] hydrolase
MDTQWFFKPKPNPNATLSLFVFHHAGGSASAYHKWSRHLPEWIELVVVELPGRGRRMNEPAIEDYESVCDEIKNQFRPFKGRSCALFGHSLGGLLAFEVAHWVKPVALGVSSMMPPIEENADRREPLSHLDDANLVQRLATYAPIPNELLREAQILKFYLDVVRHDLRLLESYRVKRYPQLTVPTMICGGNEDSGLPSTVLDGWKTLCQLQSPVQIFEGGHFYINHHYQDVISRFISLIEKVSKNA